VLGFIELRRGMQIVPGFKRLQTLQALFKMRSALPSSALIALRECSAGRRLNTMATWSWFRLTDHPLHQALAVTVSA
jgi:hypothetical protein